MSLKETDWKAVLDKPKNAGLKVGGTGISDLLRKVDKAEKKFLEDQSSVTSYDALVKLYAALIAKCDSLIKKSAAFTDACKFLDTMKHDAETRRHMLEHEGPMVRGKAQLVSSFQAGWGEMINSGTVDNVRKALDRFERALTEAQNTVPLAKAGLIRYKEIRPLVNDIGSGKAMRKTALDAFITHIIQMSRK